MNHPHGKCCQNVRLYVWLKKVFTCLIVHNKSYMDLMPAFQLLLWLGIGVKTSNIKMMILFDTCFSEAWRWSILNIVWLTASSTGHFCNEDNLYKVHPNLKAVCSTGHIGANRILLHGLSVMVCWDAPIKVTRIVVVFRWVNVSLKLVILFVPLTCFYNKFYHWGSSEAADPQGWFFL